MFDEHEWEAQIRAGVHDQRRLRAVAETRLLDTAPEDAFDRLTALAGAVLDVPWAFVTLVDDQRSFWKSSFGIGSTDLADRQLPVEESFCQYVVATRSSLLVGDAALDPRTSSNPSITSMGVRAWAGSPLRSADGQVLGTFCAVSDEAREWTPQDVRLLETLAEAAAGEMALRGSLADATAVSADLVMQLDARARLDRRGARLADLAKGLAAASTAEQVSRVVAASGPGVLGALYVNIELIDAGRTHMSVIHSPSVPDVIVERYGTMPLDESTPPGSAILRNEVVVVRNAGEFATQWPAVADDARSIGVEAAGAWPLVRADGSVMGALSVGWSAAVEFTALLRGAVSTMTQMCAAALERGQVGDTHHGLIRELQRALLAPVPVLADLDLAARYIPANHDIGFGGDWYDVFAVSATHVAVIVGDVCGHGIPAAATMAQLRGSMQALTRLKIDALDELFDDAEDWFVTEPDFVATMAVHVIDLEAGIVRYVSAGHPPALIVLPDGAVVSLDGGRRPVFGVRGPRPVVAQATYPSGAVLVACTDGLLEGGESSWDAAYDELAELVVANRFDAAAALADRIERAIGRVPADDIAFVVARRR